LSDILNLLDFTVQEYLIQAAAMDPATRFLKESDIFRLCLDVLSCKENFQYTIVRLRTEYKHPLLQYCAIGWARHGIASGDSDSILVQKVVSLFEDHQKTVLIANVLYTEGIYQNYSGIDSIISPLHIYACLGLRQLVMQLLPQPGDKVTERFTDKLPRWFWKRSRINSGNSSPHTAISVAIQAGHTDISVAIQAGHTDIALYLINHPKVDINIHGTWLGRCPLSYAAEMGNAVVARALLRRGAKHDRCDRRMRTPLSYAASKDAIEVVKLLLCIPGRNNDIPDEELRTPLSHAASANALGTAKSILNLGNVDVDSKDLLSRTPLWYAAEAGALDFVKLLLDTGKVDLHMPDYSKETPLSCAAEMGRTAVVKLLLEFDADVGARDTKGHTPLSNAVRAGQTAVVKVLMEFGADVDVRDTEGHTPLSSAARARNTAMVKVLLELGADVDGRDREGRTPLSNAARAGNTAMVKVLLELGADVDARDRAGDTPLSNAVRAENTAMVKVLLELGADVDARDRKGRTPLSNAAMAGRTAMVKVLSELGADVDARDREGLTPLSNAARAENTAMVKVLLELGADVDARDGEGRTPLSNTVRAGRTAMVRVLLEFGADVDARDKGRTPLSLAAGLWRERESTDIVKLLLESGQGVDCDSRCKLRRTPLWYAVSIKSISRVRLLLATGKVCIDSQDADGLTPLAVAAKQLDDRMVRLLLEKDANVNAKDNKGRTPLYLAVNYRFWNPRNPSIPEKERQERCLSLLFTMGGRCEPFQEGFIKLSGNAGQ
jgi:ankyrin repeat protein